MIYISKSIDSLFFEHSKLLVITNLKNLLTFFQFYTESHLSSRTEQFEELRNAYNS